MASYVSLGIALLLFALTFAYFDIGTRPSSYPGVSDVPVDTSTPLVVHLVITEANFSGLSGKVQPMMYIDSSEGMQSSANIALPAHRLIELVITNYDRSLAEAIGDEYGGLPAMKVAGTVGGTVSVLNGTTWDGGDTRSAGFVDVQSVGAISHTFTIMQLGINIPVPAASTVVAYLYLNSTGSYVWLCLCYCGDDYPGWGGGMQTAGWMEGAVTAA